MIDLRPKEAEGLASQRFNFDLPITLGVIITLALHISPILGEPLANGNFNNISSNNLQDADPSLINSIDYARSEQFLPNNVFPNLFNMSVTPNWIEGTHSFWYLNTGREGKEFVLVDAENSTKQLAFNHSALAQALAVALYVDIDPSNLPFSNIIIVDGEIIFSAFNTTWQFNPGNNNVKKIRYFREARPGETLSPDGNFAVYVQNHNLWIRDTKSDKRIALTTDGSEDYAYAERSGTVLHPISQIRQNETPNPYAVWSPDSKRIATFRMNQIKVIPLYLLQNVPDNNSRPKLWTYRFAMPNDEQVPIYEPLVINIPEGKVVPVYYKPQPEVSLMDTDSDVLQWWSDDSQMLFSLHADRGEKALHLLKTNPDDGRTEEILEETGSSYVEANLDYASLPNTKVLGNGDLIWFSEKNGYGHLYLYDKHGQQKNVLTSGNGVVRKLVYVDENKSTVYFTASGREAGRDPYYRHLYKVDLNGSGLRLLTPEDADHDIQAAPDGMTFVDTYSRVDLPPVIVLRDQNGNITLTLEEGDITNLTNKGWKPPETFSTKALDGEIDLYGLIIKPTDFDASKKYPVVETVYPGPWIIVTAKSFPGVENWVNKIFWRGQALAEQGFIVVTLDGPGTPYRSKEFHDVSYGHLGDAGGLDDHVNALKKLAKERPYMDLNRVGIFGHSAGGFMTAQALLTYPDVYKTGVASSGDYDSRFYGAFWGEKYEGLESDYKEQITSLKAGNLTGKLFLITGDVDDNVNPCMTMQLANSFINANKSFDLLVMTNRNHDLSYDPYYLHRLFSYFVEHLK